MKYIFTLTFFFAFVIRSMGQITCLDIYDPEIKGVHMARVNEFFQAFDKNELEILSQLVSANAKLDTNLVVKYRSKIKQEGRGYFWFCRKKSPLEYERIYFEEKDGKKKELFAVILFFDAKNSFTVDHVCFDLRTRLPKQLKKALAKLNSKNVSKKEKWDIVKNEISSFPPQPNLNDISYNIDWVKNKIRIDISECYGNHPFLEDYDAVNQLGFPITITSYVIVDSIGIPTWLQQLKNIQYLGVVAADIASVPEEIDKLKVKNLILRVFRVKLPAIPASIGNLEQLEELTISCKECTELPPTLTKLKKLKKFEFQGNKLNRESTFMVYELGGTIRYID
ncbi:MAG: hypothetical protein IPN76_18050 [Saprospiraceae bacterium]|nr:hypothetical protein [Saprospiraceae bacterium]